MSVNVDFDPHHLGDDIPLTIPIYEPGTTDPISASIAAWTFQLWCARGARAAGQDAAFTQTTGFSIDDTTKTVTVTIPAASTDLLQVGMNCYVLRRTNSGAAATLAHGAIPIAGSRTA
jgi:hypothetical protein